METLTPSLEAAKEHEFSIKWSPFLLPLTNIVRGVDFRSALIMRRDPV
jgi:hypothetical protein